MHEFIPTIKTIPYDEDIHHALACEWWRDWEWPEMTTELLPKDTGAVATYKGNPTCMGWLFTTNSKFCVIELFISDKNQPKKVRNESVEAVIDHLISLALEKGFKVVFSSFTSKKMISRFLERGFMPEASTSMTLRIA